MDMPRHPTLPRIVRRRSGLHGYGVFAAEPITKNRRIIDYAGELIRNDVAAGRESGISPRVHLGVPGESPLEPRRQRRRERRPVHQPCVPAQLLVPGGRRDDLDPRLAPDPGG